MRREILVLACAVACVASCRAQHVFRQMNWSFNRMLLQQRYNAYKPSRFFPNGAAMQRPPSGTVVFHSQTESPEVATGLANGEPIVRVPLPLTRALLERGQERFDTFCAACHGLLGNGDTVVAEHMGRPPPSLHEDRIRRMPDGFLFSVISTGYGLMPNYTAQLDARDRWAVVAYVRALELSRNAKVADLTPAMRRDMHKELP